MNASAVKNFKKGEILFNEGDVIEHLYFINTGKVKTYLQRARNQIEIHQYAGAAVFGDAGVVGPSKFLFSALAISDVTALMFPIEAMKNLIENSAQLERALVKSLVEQNKNLFSALKNHKMHLDPSPCPEDLVPRLFGGIFYFVDHLGARLPLKEKASTPAQTSTDATSAAGVLPKNPESVKIQCSWVQFKQYCFRIFNLPLDKLENACHLLCKLGLLEYVYEANEDEPELGPQLSQLVFKDHYKIEQFFEFYQYYFYRSAKAEMLKVDENIHQIVRGILQFTEKEEVDRKGVIRVQLNPLLDYIKTKMNININSTHWTLFDQRGLFSKRSQVDNIFYYSFNLEEFQRFYNASRFLRELQKWNDVGSVNPKELEYADHKGMALEGAQIKCPQCQSVVMAQQKFCGECGAKL